MQQKTTKIKEFWMLVMLLESEWSSLGIPPEISERICS